MSRYFGSVRQNGYVVRNIDAALKHWTEVLGIERIGVYDNFFEIGGDSVSAVLTTGRIQRTFDMDLPLPSR